MSNAVEIIADKLYWVSDRNPPRNIQNAYFFCIDNDLIYDPFFADFGPLNIGMTYKFCTELKKLLDNEQYSKYKVYHYTTLDQAKRANAACLIGCFQVMMLGRTAEEAWARIANVRPGFVDFRDASFGPCVYKCTILHVLRGLQFAVQLGWYDWKSFNLKDYEFYEKVENGDFNWILPGKLLAFSGPAASPYDSEGWRTFTPEDYAPLFKKMGITNVIRLNKKQYDASRFTKLGIAHNDLFFIDGSPPPEEIILQFLDIVENAKGAIAIHCKAGLGRTGSLIACYCMKHFKFPAPEFIGYIRLMRPGSVLGPQQQYLCDIQEKCFAYGAHIENPLKGIENLKIEAQEMSEYDQQRLKHGEIGQGEDLVDAKRKRKEAKK